MGSAVLNLVEFGLAICLILINFVLAGNQCFVAIRGARNTALSVCGSS